MEIKCSQPTAKGAAGTFTGDVWVDVVCQAEGPSRARVGIVHFSPGARSAWHSHAFGQVLFVTEGTGRAQARGGPVVELRPGDTVYTPPGEEHWHGAAPEHFMTHLSITEDPGDDQVPTHWGPHVTEAEYDGQPG